MKNRVRYICVPVTSFELADALPEHEKSVFIAQVLKMFNTCESGEDPVPDKTENRVLDIALEGAAREIKKGYDTYARRASGNRNNDDSPEVNHSTTNGRPMVTEERKELSESFDKDLSESLDKKGKAFSIFEYQDIQNALDNIYVSPDPQFFSYAQKVGYKITLDAINKAALEKTRSLARIVMLMKEAAKGEIA